MNKKIVILILVILFPFTLFSQGEKDLQDLFLEGEYFLMNEDYTDALPCYLKLLEKLPDNANIAYRTGVCYLNIPGEKDLSVSYLETAVRKMSSRHKDGTISQVAAPYDALYQLGLAYRMNYKFDKAKETFSKYLETLLPEDAENISFIKHEISTCENASRFIEKPVDFTIENMGEVFNNDRNNFNPVVSADGKAFIFMSSLPFYNAVMFSRVANGKWCEPVNITPDLQVDQGIFVSGLSADSKTLYLSQDDNFDSDILSATFDGTKWSKAVKLNNNINTKYWESSGYISEDGNYFYFSSDRPGGFGGLDIYVSKKENGEWGPAVNLGNEINSSLNEDRPSITGNGRILFFASQDHANMGGYDIFRSEKLATGIWKKPENLGYPLNTPDDNIFFTPSENGKAGYISVFRDGEGFGNEDIYRIRFK
jgi:tetratricopeptide (TPR) repeat protein